MSRIPKQQRAKITVQAIVEAGFICVSELGLEATTTRHIADKAGVSVGSLYEYFTNKEEIYKAMEAHIIQQVIELLQAKMQNHALMTMSPVELIKYLLAQFKDLLQENNNRYLMYIRSSFQVNFGSHLTPINQMLTEMAMRMVLQNPEQFTVRHLRAMTYIFINGGVYSVVRFLTDPNPSLTYEELSEGLANMVGHYVAQEVLLHEKEQKALATKKPKTK